MKIIIIEDERFTAEDLSRCITEIRPNYEISTILSSIKEAQSYFKQHPDVNLVFSDIHLGDGLSFEIFKSNPINAPVIFCTAYDNHAIEAFKANGIDYVLKPISKKNILESIEKFEKLTSSNFVQNNKMNEIFELFKSKPIEKASKSIVVYVKDKIIPIKIDDIALFYIKNEVTSIIDLQGQLFSTNDTLEEIEQIVGSNFFRANRQYLVNRTIIKEAVQHFARKLLLNLSIPFQEQIIISKEKTPLFLKWLAEN